MVTKDKVEMIQYLYNMYFNLSCKDVNAPTSNELIGAEEDIKYVAESLFTALDAYVKVFKMVKKSYIEQLEKINIDSSNIESCKSLSTPEEGELLGMLSNMFIAPENMIQANVVDSSIESQQLHDFHTMMNSLQY